jgi:hypothetical protein
MVNRIGSLVPKNALEVCKKERKREGRAVHIPIHFQNDQKSRDNRQVLSTVALVSSANILAGR